MAGPRTIRQRQAEQAELRERLTVSEQAGEAHDQETYRRHFTLEHGGETDGLVCWRCGKPVAHEDARIIVGVIDGDRQEEREQAGLDPWDGTTLPPLAECVDHDQHWPPHRPVHVERLPAAAKRFYGQLKARNAG